MSNSPKIVRRIEPHRERSFDQQFWPVLVALGVLCGIAFGAALTLLRGPWMWGSLLVLPASAALAIYLLYRLDDSRLRRSLQLAILLSLASHLLILIVASATNIFQNEYEQKQPQVAKRQTKTIMVRNKQNNFVWDQPNSQETPEPKVEVQREQTNNETTPQPVPVEASKPTVNPQVTKRPTPAKTVPRLDKELSQLRRQTSEVTPQLSSRSVTQAANQKSSPTPTQSASAASSASQRQAAESKVQPVQNQPAPNPASASPTQVSERKTTTQPRLDSPSTQQSLARVRRSSPRIPISSSRQAVTNSTQPPTQTSRPVPEPSKASTQVTRRDNTQPTPSPARTNQPKTVASPKSAVAKTSERRQTPPTISRPQATPETPRRSSLASRIPTTTRMMESPTRAPTSPTDARQLSSRSLSVSRGESGAVGAVRQNNLESETGGQVSPATRASDSAVRRRSEQANSVNQLLTPSQTSTERRSVAQAQTPSSAFKSNTSAQAPIAGSAHPGEKTLQASASSSQTSATAPTGEVSVQKGETSIDIGPTKVVSEQTSERRSGGGQPDVGAMDLENVARSSRRSNDRAPTLSAEMGTQTAASLSPTSSPAGELETQPNAESLTHARTGADQPMSYDRGAAQVEGPASDAGASTATGQFADSRARAERDSPFAAGDSEDDEDEMLKGNSRSRIAQAPSLSNQTTAGGGNLDSGVVGSAQSGSESSELSDSTASRLVERAANSFGNSLARGAVQQMVQSAAAMPVTDFSTTRRNDRGRSQMGTAEELNSESQGKLNSRTARKGNGPSPTLTSGPTTTSNQSIANRNGESASEQNIEAASTVASRDSQVEGARLEIDAVEGPAGLGQTPSVSLGVRTRPASKTSESILPDMQQRFRSKTAGGTPAVNPNAIVARDAFRARQPSSIGSAEPSTEAAIQMGLEFLSRYQNQNGSWSLHGFDREHPMNESQLQSDSAATGLALLAFQGAGYTHKEFKYALQVDQGLKWFVENQQDDGCLFVPSGNKSDDSCRMYSHAIATLALCEAYGMTQDPELREPTQRAIDWIEDTQDPKNGGWRYFSELKNRKTDTSVTGWMLMALQSGRLAGLKTDKKTLAGIEGWLDVAVDPNRPSQFRYNPYSKDTSDKDRSTGREPTPPMTAVGLLMRIYGGLQKNDPILLDGAQSLIERQLPNDVNSMLRDTYYWYYATQVLKHVDGDLWEFWNNQLHPLLIRSQHKTGDMAGSWHPYEPVPDRWGIHAGRLYVTTMNLLSLEVRYRLLPLYEETIGK